VLSGAGFIFQAPGVPDKLNRAQGTQVIDDQNSLRGDVNRFQTIREEITCTVSDAADVDTETHALCQALIAAEGCVSL
jgi:hypothetical protein